MVKKREFVLLFVLLVVLLLVLFSFFGNLVPVPNPSEKSENKIPENCGILKIYILNVSQADSILIITPNGTTILIDSGSLMRNNSASHVVEFLKSLGIARIDHLIATHMHEDHIGGMGGVYGNFQIVNEYDNGNCGNQKSSSISNFQNLAANSSLHHAVRNDMDVVLDGCFFKSRILSAYGEIEKSGKCFSNENDNSLILYIEYGVDSFIFMGDCENKCEGKIAGKNVYADFIKVGHHGSATSSSFSFLKKINPSIYAFSTDKDRSAIDGYFHPRMNSLKNVFNSGGRNSTYRTDLNGDITLISDGRGINVGTKANASICEIFSGYSTSEKGSYGVIESLTNNCS